MYNQQPQLYTTRHYIHDPQSNSTNYSGPSYDRSGPPTQTYRLIRKLRKTINERKLFFKKIKNQKIFE
jgi:hypothetical protein